MKIELLSTTSSKIAQSMVRARRASGSPAMDMVLTLVVITDEEGVVEAMHTATALSREHPSRVIGVIRGSSRGRANLDAKIRVGHDSTGESILLRVSGELTKHAESVVLPLLLPDSPVVVWWPNKAPEIPSQDAIGRLAQRRLTDAESTASPIRALRTVARNHAPGDTDLSWTRLTPWRALLAAALDQTNAKVTGGQIVTGAGNPAAELLVGWLESRLNIKMTTKRGEAAHIFSVTLETAIGDVTIERINNMTCNFSVPGAADHQVPLAARTRAELLAEDLRRLDNDEIYQETISHLLKDLKA
ncbi:MAG: glucose-6-phosphate dehydrogenase assembly protein OpcA [Aeromicrobium sp.]